MRQATTLGVVGWSPTPVAATAQARRFASLQRFTGLLESAPQRFVAGHAACHALLNGVERVVFANDIQRLVAVPSVELIVAPGFVGEEDVSGLIQAVVAHTDAVLWLDAPRGAGAEAIAAYRGAIGGDAERVRVCAPWVDTLTPGLRDYVSLPPSCLVGPLALGRVDRLRGAHRSPRRFDDAAQEVLRGAGCGLLSASGPRAGIGLALVDRALPPSPDAPSDESELARAAREAVEPLLLRGEPNAAPLWKRLEREVRAALAPFAAAPGTEWIRVRCDHETNFEAGNQPVVEILVKRRRRVERVVIRMAESG